MIWDIFMQVQFQSNFEKVLIYFPYFEYSFINLDLIFFDQGFLSKSMDSIKCFFCEMLSFLREF